MEMKRGIKKYKLDFDKTISYFIEHIQCGKTLSKKIVEKVNFRKGVFYTFLPSNAEISRLFDFSHGGIIPPIPYGINTYKIDGFSENFHPQQVMIMDRECSEFIYSYLKKGEKNCAILENYMFEPENLHANIRGVKMTPYEKEVYYFLDKENSIEEIYETVRKSSEVWHSLFVLTQMNAVLTINPDYLDKICDNAKFIIAGAYDGEGSIWEKKN